jgi:hypothetical protein
MYLIPVLFTFYTQNVLQLKNNSGAKRLTGTFSNAELDNCTYFAHEGIRSASRHDTPLLRLTDIILKVDNYLSTAAVFLDIENPLIPPGLNYKILRSNFSFSTVNLVQLSHA